MGSDEPRLRTRFTRRSIVSTTTRETICGANNDDRGLTNWVTSLRRAPTSLFEQAAAFSRYQLKRRTEADRVPNVAGNRKSSAAANNHGVLWKCACAEKNLSGRCGSPTPYFARQRLSTLADTAAALIPWPNLGL